MDQLMEFIGTPAGTAVGVAFVGLLVFVLFPKVKADIIAEHAYCAHVAQVETEFGLSSVMTAPMIALSTGDVTGAIGKFIAKVDYLKNPANRATELAGVVAAAMADPNRKAAMTKLAQDIVAGAPSDQIKADVSASFDASSLSKLGYGPIGQHLQHVADTARTLANKPELAGLLGQFSPATLGNLAGPLTSLIDAAHSIGTNATVSVPAATDTTTPATK